LMGYGLIQSKVDACVYIMEEPYLIVTTQVDNINTWYKKQKTYNDFYKYLGTKFLEVTQVFAPRRIVGINIHYLKVSSDENFEDIMTYVEQETHNTNDDSKDTLFRATKQTSPSSWKCNCIVMEQKHYIEPIVVSVTKERDIPLPSTVDLNKYEKGDGKITLYEEMGTLRYLADRTRPDIMTAVTMMSSHMIHPNDKHVKLTGNIKGYLKQSKNDFKLIRKMRGDKYNMTLFA